MTIVQALDRIANRYAGKLYALLSATEKQTAIEALNSAMFEVFRLLPQEYRTKTLHLAVEAPATVSIEAVEGSADLGNTAFTDAQLSRTVVAQGDAIWHQVGDTNALRDVWLGTTGTYAGIVYHDYVYGDDYPFERLLTNPILYDGNAEIALCQVNPEMDTQTYGGGNRMFGGGLISNTMRSIGKPVYYWIESAGASQGAEPVIAIRLLPLPDRAYRLRIKASYWPRRVLFSDVEGAATLPVPDVCAEALVQIAGPHLSGIPGFTIMQPAIVSEMAASAREFATAQPSLLSLPRGRIYTPAGY